MNVITFLAAFAAFALITLALGIGLLVDGRRLERSCGAAGDCRCNPLVARVCARRSRS